MEQKKEILEQAMVKLKQSLDFDSTAIDHIHLALYSFQVSLLHVVHHTVLSYLSTVVTLWIYSHT